MEIVIDVKIVVKGTSYRNVITDFGYFKKITGESNQNISYIRNATRAEFSMKPSSSGLNNGLTIALKHNTLDGVDNAKRLLLSLIDTMKDDFEAYKSDRGIPSDGVRVLVELNLASCGECSFMSTSFPEFEDHVSKHRKTTKTDTNKTPWGTSATRTTTNQSFRSGTQSSSSAPATRTSTGFGAVNRNSVGFGTTRSSSSAFGAAPSVATTGGSPRSGYGAIRTSGNFGATRTNGNFGGNRSSGSLGATGTSGGLGTTTRASSGFRPATRSGGLLGSPSATSWTKPQSLQSGNLRPTARYAARSQLGSASGRPAPSSVATRSFGAAIGAPAAARRPVSGLAAKRFALGFAASKYARVMGRPGVTTRLAASGPAAASRLVPAGTGAPGTRRTTFAGANRQPAAQYSRFAEQKPGSSAGVKRGLQGVTDVAANKRQKLSRFANNTRGDQTDSAGAKKQDGALSREENLLARRLRRNLNDDETKAAIQQLKSKLSAREMKMLFEQVEETEKRERLATRSDYITLQLKVLVGALRRKSEGIAISTSGKLQTATSVKAETDRVLELYKKKQFTEKVLQSLLNKYVAEYKFNRDEKTRLQNQIQNESKMARGFQTAFQKSMIQFRHVQKALVSKVESSGSVYCSFDPLAFINSQKEPAAVSRRNTQVGGGASRSPPDAERMVAVRIALDAVLRRRNANVLKDNAVEAIVTKLMDAVAIGPQTASTLRQSWESLIKRKQFQDRREPDRASKVTIKLRTVANYIKQQVEDRHITNQAMEAIMGVLKPQPKPSDPDLPSTDVPIFPVLEKPHATERSIQTRLQWLIAEIKFILNKRKAGQLPDQEVEMMITRIKNGVPPIYYDVVHGRFQETARDIERMAGRQMSPSRNLTCKLQVICTYARHYLLDKLPGGSPLDPAQQRNPFQYIDYSIDARPQRVQSTASKVTSSPKPLMGMSVGTLKSRRVSDIESLMGVMDKEAAQEERMQILELREYAKEANIGKASMAIRRVEKVEADLLKKLPAKYKDDLQAAKEQTEDTKGRLLTARERLETSIKWILGNVHAGPDRSKASASPLKKGGVPPIIRMKGAEPLKRDMMKVWNQLKTGRVNTVHVNLKLNELRSRLTRPESEAMRKEYDRQMLNLCKKHQVSRLADPAAAATKFEVVLKYVLGDDSPIAKQSVARDIAQKHYDALKENKSPVKAQGTTVAKKSAIKPNGTPAANKTVVVKKAESDDDIMIVETATQAKKQRKDVRITVLRNKFNILARDFKQNKIDTDKMAELIALMKMNLYLSCDDEDELFTQVRAAWEQQTTDDLDEQKKLQLEFDLTTKRILAKVGELIDGKAAGVSIKDVKERLSCVMTGKMVEMELVEAI